MSKMSEKAIDELNRLNDEGKIVVSSTPRGKNRFYDNWVQQLVDDKKSINVNLLPEEDWLRGGTISFPKFKSLDVATKVKEPVTCIHTWHKVTLFTSTVEECSKCGKLRD